MHNSHTLSPFISNGKPYGQLRLGRYPLFFSIQSDTFFRIFRIVELRRRRGIHLQNIVDLYPTGSPGMRECAKEIMNEGAENGIRVANGDAGLSA